MNTSFLNVYAVPYLRFKKSDKIIIYGAGRIGTSYVKNICESRHCEIVAIVDKNYNNQKPICEIAVEAPDIINRCEFDYILIAIENYKIAQEIRCNLIKSGVQDDKIVLNCNDMIGESLRPYQEYIKLLQRNGISKKRRFFLFMLPEHGNAGDYLIGYSEQHFFEKYFPNIQVITVTTLEWIYSKEYIMGMVRPNDIIFLNGGGYIGDVWQDAENYQSIVNAFPDNVKFFFPNTLTYLSNAASYPKFIEEMNWFSLQKKLFVMLRDNRSYQFVKDYNVNVAYFPDFALINSISNLEKNKTNRVLLCLREDREKFIDGDKIRRLLKNKGIDYDELNISKGVYVSQEDGRLFVDELINEMQNHSIVITDRLHGMIMATISNVPCIAFDNTTCKVSGVYEWIQDYVYLASENDTEKIDEIIPIAINKKENSGNYKALLEFGQMAEYIRDIIEEHR